MKISIKFLIIAVFIFLTNCNGKKEKEVKLNTLSLEDQMIEAYTEGVKALNNGDAIFAAKNFNAAEILYPQSIWAQKSILMSAYSYYSQDYYGDAIFELNRFLKKYPSSPDIPYAYFMIAMCYYELIIDEKKDISPLLKSKENFQIIINEYPDTDYAIDSKYKILLINNILAAKELYLAKYYLSREKWIPSINRFQNIIENYSDTEYAPEALHRLVELNYNIGLIKESKKYASTLGYNYLSSKWYKESYKIFNKDYQDPIEKIKKDKNNLIFKKFKNLF